LGVSWLELPAILEWTRISRYANCCLSISENEARSFLASRGFDVRVREADGVFWTDLTKLGSGQVLVEGYGRGQDPASAISDAFDRYCVEEADWDTRGLELILQFTPTRTASHSLRLRVTDAFAAEGLRIDSWTVPYGEDQEIPGVKWADPSLEVILESSMGIAVLRRIAYPLGEALAAIRRTEPQLPFGITIKLDDQQLRLAFRVWDPSEAIREGMTAVLAGDLSGHMIWGWANDQKMWVRI
jgi:hypothetical protein